MNGDHLQSSSRKSLRRKPPPPMDDFASHQPEPVQNISNHPLDIFHTSPSRSPHHRKGAPLSINPHLTKGASDVTVEEISLLSYESPRPMGPKELPFDEYSGSGKLHLYPDDSDGQEPGESLNPRDSYFLPHSFRPALATSGLSSLGFSPQIVSPQLFESRSSRSRFPPRKFQNLLQSGISPFQSNRDEESNSPLPSVKPMRHHHSIGSNLGPTPPYPIKSDLEFSDYEDDESFSFLPKDVALGTPSRIPALVDDFNLKQLPTGYQDDTGETSYFRTSPPGISNPFARSNSQSSLSSLSSPSKSPVSRYMGRTYLSFVNDSRSPSPKKYGSPPRAGFADATFDDEQYFDDLKDERTPRWSLLEHEPFEYYEEDTLTPATSQFDYSILPDLPKGGESPNRHSMMQSAMSFMRRKDDIPYATMSLKRRNDELPPVPLDLPLLPFSSSSLVTQHFLACANVWSLHAIFGWCLKLSGWLHDLFISKQEFRKALIKLVVFHKRDIPLDLIGRNVNHIINTLESIGAVSQAESPQVEGGDAKNPETGVVFHFGEEVSGILVELTDCYCHDNDHRESGHSDTTLKCYSSLCQMNKVIEHEVLMKNTSIHDLVLGYDWASHWQLTAEDIHYDLAISKRQSFIFDLIKFEQNFIQRAECFVNVVGPEFINSAKILVGSSVITLNKFDDDILKPAEELLTIHRASLFEPLLKVLISDGKIIKDVVSIAGLYYAWSKSAKSALLRYMSTVPVVEDLLRTEALKNWDERLRSNPRVKELQVNGNMLLLSTFNSRYQQLPLQLSDIQKTFDLGDPEFIEISKAIDAIKLLGTKVNEMKVHADNIHSLRRVEKHLTWKSNIHQPNIHFSSEQRKFFYRGELTRKGDLKINTNTVFMIVLDNYLLITERSRKERAYTYKVIETPIPVDYLILENREKEGGLNAKASVLTSPSAGNRSPDGEESEPMSYPFKIRYAGRGKYQAFTLFAGSEIERKKWFNALLQARSNLVRKVQPVAPYTLQLVENSFFAYEFANRITKLPICSLNDPIQVLAKGSTTNLTAKKILSDIYSPNNPRNSLVFSKVQCSEEFTYRKTTFHIIGLATGVYLSDLKNMWKKMVNGSNVTKISVLPSHNVVLLLASKTLRYYPLHLLVDIYYEKKETITSIQISNNPILFYEVGRHRGIATLFVAKKKNAGSTNFKVFALETDNDGIMSTFSIIKRFYIQADCYGISVFNTSVAIHTQRGFEILDLDKLTPRTVPELPPPELSKKFDGYNRKANTQGSTDLIRKAIAHAVPMGMFKLTNNKEFVLVYNECAIFVNKTGRLSRTSMVRFDFRPKSISFFDNSLFLVCDEVIEVWSISDQPKGSNKLFQVIPGKDITMTNATSLCFSMANPRVQGLQMVFQMRAKPDKEVS